VAMHIVDRRLNPGSKSLENRQRFLRRAKALVQGAVKKSSQDRDIKDVLEGGEVSIPLDGMNEPRFRREGGTRDMVLPGNKKYVEGDMLPRSGEGRGKRASDPGEGDGEDAFRFVLSRDEFVDLFLDDLELPDLAKRKLAEAESEGLRRAGYSTSGSPANISVSRTVSRALARRVALRRPRPETIAQLEAEIADCDEARRVELMAELDALKAKFRRIPYIDPIDIRYRRFETMPKPVAQAVMFCLMDVSGSMSEHMKDLAKRFYMLLYVFLTRRYRPSRSSSFVIPTGRKKSTKIPSFTDRHRAVPCCRARCGRCTRSSGRGFAPLTRTSTPPRPPTETTPFRTERSWAGC
jgi:uncharacterized protein